jgi:hypothetical protein
MKGVIASCLAELVKSKFGEHKWREILQQSGENPYMVIRVMSDIDDQTIFKLFENTCKVLDLSKEQAHDAFGDYWVNTFAPRMYGLYYERFKNAKEFIMGMDNIHDIVTRNMPNAHPPRFIIEEVDENTIIVNYQSTRNMIDFYIGLVKGIGTYFHTQIYIKKLSEKRVELIFSS